MTLTKPRSFVAVPSVPRIMSWDTQAKQYEQDGAPGITFFRGDLDDMEPVGTFWVNCLLHYGEDRTLDGIMNHYPMDIPPYEKAGAFNIWVRPDRRRTGIASRLLAEAQMRWKVNVTKQRWTEDGAAWINGLLAR